MRINYKRSQLAMLSGVFLLMAVTLFMAFAGPYTLFNLKQSETTEIKTVIVVARHGDEWPSNEAYFFGEQPGDEMLEHGRHSVGQLTNTGKERMFLLGKFLRLRYYERLLRGDPQRLQVRSAGSDKCLESAQLLAAGLNPPQASSTWSHGPDHELAMRWQPKAVHSNDERTDDLLSSRSKCLLNYERANSGASAWKNSTKYLQLLNEFRHDLQVLRKNTGLEFEDDLEMLVTIEEHLKARAALGNAPSWYTSTLAQRLAHIADVTLGCKFGERDTQRLYAGRLLDVIASNIFGQVHGDEQALTLVLTEDEEELDQFEAKLHATLGRSESPKTGRRTRGAAITTTTGDLVGAAPKAPSMSLYLTDEQHLTALLQALKIYSAQPHYGFLLIIELHHDPSNKVHFLRLYTVNSLIHNTFPEPVRVNPIACPIDSVECSPEQFEQNIRHLSVDKQTWWKQLCNHLGSHSVVDDYQQLNPIGDGGGAGDEQSSNPSVPVPSTQTDLSTAASASSSKKPDYYEKLDQSLIVGPTDLRPPAGGLPSSLFSMQPTVSTPSDDIITTTTTSYFTPITEAGGRGNDHSENSNVTTTTLSNEQSKTSYDLPPSTLSIATASAATSTVEPEAETNLTNLELSTTTLATLSDDAIAITDAKDDTIPLTGGNNLVGDDHSVAI